MSPRNLLRALLPRATPTPGALRSPPGRQRLAAESLEPRAMLATTTFSSDLSPFTKVPVTFRKPGGAVGFSSTALAGQLSWSGMTGDARKKHLRRHHSRHRRRARQWLAAFDATARNSVVLYALQSPTAVQQAGPYTPLRAGNVYPQTKIPRTTQKTHSLDNEP